MKRQTIKYAVIKKPGDTAKKKQKKKIIITSIAVGAAGILGYFAWRYLKKKKDSQKDDLNLLTPAATSIPKNVDADYSAVYTPPKTKPSVKPKTTTASYQSTGDSFPLKRGSKGNNVRLLQQALIAKHGKSILPRYGADGDFGTETVNALKKAGLPDSVSESTFNVLTEGTKFSASTGGKDLYTATVAKNYNKALSILKQMQSTDDYSAANTEFKKNRINGVRQTIVNGLLNIFTTASQKEAIKLEFLRMGLQFDGNKWSLSGFDGRPIVTTEEAMVWINATQGVKVPARMVLGSEISRRLDYTLFENNGKYFLVTTKSVQYL